MFNWVKMPYWLVILIRNMGVYAIVIWIAHGINSWFYDKDVYDPSVPLFSWQYGLYVAILIVLYCFAEHTKMIDRDYTGKVKTTSV